jgi:hypothetical protein
MNNQMSNNISTDVEKQMVICLKRTKKDGIIVNADVYIGRKLTMGGWNLQESIWHNPFTIKEYGLEECLKKYEKYIRGNNVLMNKIVHDLDGKTLGCFCKKKGNEPCHGDILIKIINEIKNESSSQ